MVAEKQDMENMRAQLHEGRQELSEQIRVFL